MAHHCALCEAEKVTKWYYEDEELWVADCLSCNVPMVVTRNPEPKKVLKITAVKLLQRLFPGRKIDLRRRAIPDHWHVHAR